MSDEAWAPRATTSAPESGGPMAGETRPPAAIDVPGYTDLVELAQGGDSVVYHARQISLDREVAIKVVRISDPSIAERFRREVEITVRLGRQHPHIVTVLDTTTATTGELCLVMDFHDLGSVHDRLQAHGPLSASEVVEAGTAVADALAFAHRAGVLHRDVKPQNILVLPTSFVLSDFGIARQMDADRTASLERFSYRHASPQVLDGMMPTEADDVWSLGSTLFTLLDGRAPFAGDDPEDDSALTYLRRVRLNERRPLRRDDLPDGLREFIDRALAPAREDRIATAAEALAILRGLRTEGRSWEPDATAPASAPTLTTPVPPTPMVATSEAGASAPAIMKPAAGDDPSPSAAETARPPVSEAAASGIRPDDDASGTRPAADPAPVARSALADLDQPSLVRPAGRDDDATGTLIPDADPDRAPADRDVTGGSGRTWRRTVLFLGGMLIAGAIVGAVVFFLSREAPDDTPPAPPAEQTVPSASAPPADDGTQPTVSDPDFAPQDLVITDRGTSALLTWALPSGTVTSIAVVQVVEGGSPVVLANLAGSATEYTVEGLDPDAEACFAVAGYGMKDGTVTAGSSPQTCTR